MKKSLVILAMLAAFGAQAQDSNSTSQSGSNSGSTSTSGATAIGNQNSSQSASGSQSGASSGSLSGAMGNNLTINNNGPETQTVNANSTSTSRAEQILNGGTTNTNTDNIRYSGVVENRTTGGTNSTVNENVHYSGTQTIKNVPGIAMSGPASGPCTGVSGSISAAGPGFGIGLNGSSVMADCRLRENTRVIGMAMQSLDGGANPQEKGELTVLFMDAVRGLAAYNNQIIADEVKKAK